MKYVLKNGVYRKYNVLDWVRENIWNIGIGVMSISVIYLAVLIIKEMLRLGLL